MYGAEAPSVQIDWIMLQLGRHQPLKDQTNGMEMKQSSELRSAGD